MYSNTSSWIMIAFRWWFLQFQEAADLYREVLQSVDEHARAEHFHTDALQTLHAVANLHKLLCVHAEKISGRAVSDEQLPQRVFSIPRLLSFPNP